MERIDKYQNALPASPTGYEEVTITAVVTRPTLALVERCRFAILTFQDGPVRYRDDGTAPTAGVGVPVFDNERVALSIASLRQLRLIRTGASNGLLRLRYYA